MNKRSKILFVTLILSFAASVFIAKTWAIVDFVKPQDASHKIPEAQISQIPSNSLTAPRSRVPEPFSLILFGGGICSMVVAFLRKAYSIAKRMMDIIMASFALIILSPLCLLVAILIKFTSRGPVIYTQIRSGKENVLFNIYKFRTMQRDAEKQTGPVWATHKDSRVTSVGKFLRKSRIDEIPQFINVLQGDMSIVGPRPERPVFIETLKTQISDYPKRLAVKPGITGLAQVHHRYDENIADVRKKVKYDILYIKNMRFGTDLSIIRRTFGVIFTGFGSH